MRDYEYPEPEWTAENQNRRKGETTLKQCGWCEYASCGSCRHDCYLSTSCSLLKEYGVGREVYWDTECIVKKLGKDDFKSVISSKNYAIKNHKDGIKSLQKEIAIIKGLKLKEKPLLPDNRPYDYYNLNDVIYVFFNKHKKWVKGKVVRGYRHQDGCVSYVLEDYPESRKGWGCGASVPWILKEWEYKFFKKYPADFKDWLELSNREYNGKKMPIKDYEKALLVSN